MAPLRFAAVSAIVAALALAVGPLGHLAASGPLATAPPIEGIPAASPSAGLNATVTWNGEPASDASSALTAFSIVTGQNASVNFTFEQPVGASPATNASLILWFGGAQLSSEQLPTTYVAGVGYAEMSWSFGTLYEFTEGVYELEAELTDRSGASLFAEAFYVDAKAPYEVVSAIVVFALILAAAELYWTVVVLRRTRKRPRRIRRP